jgi:hypothetical protein
LIVRPVSSSKWKHLGVCRSVYAGRITRDRIGMYPSRAAAVLRGSSFVPGIRRQLASDEYIPNLPRCAVVDYDYDIGLCRVGDRSAEPGIPDNHAKIRS